jgi:polyisoprenyl-teichoic acid--peptidoglycan teichoic acid transferase
MWKRFLVAGALITALSGAATATIALNTVGGIASEVFPALNKINAPKGLVTPEYSGGPETFLILGSDRREGSKNSLERGATPHSDTLLLVRFDPSQGQTSVMSIPRDLLVNITDPHGGVWAGEKINAAYTIGSKFGGAKGGIVLAAETIVNEVFPELKGKLNGIIDVNFKGFIKVVDTLGCAYVNVDHHYYNANVGTAATDYTSINLQPGYQKLCYESALNYVRYRHEDSDFVRVARQQDFLRNLREQISPSNEIGQIDNVAKAVGHAIVQAGFSSSASELIELTKAAPGEVPHQQRQRADQGRLLRYIDPGARAEDARKLHPRPRTACAAQAKAQTPLQPPPHALEEHQRSRSRRRAEPLSHVLRRRGRSRQSGPQRALRNALPDVADRARRAADGARLHARRPAAQQAPRLRRRVAGERPRRLLRLRGQRLVEPAPVRARTHADDRRALIPVRQRRLAHTRDRMARRTGAVLAHEHAARGTFESADVGAG